MIKYIDGKRVIVPHGLLAKECLGLTLELQALKSNAGWYLGTVDKEGPVSRESEQYWSTKEEAEEALRTSQWFQKSVP